MALKKASELLHAVHGFGPYFDSESRILILGSFPSVLSRAKNFYYGHPVNRFWPLLSHFFDIPIPNDIDGKKKILKDIHIALYDVIDECDITGSSDVSIKNPILTDISSILSESSVQKILLNGKKAGELFVRYQLPIIGDRIPYFVMPSTSPANAAYRLDDLIRAWAPELLICKSGSGV
ncbi:MAG: DNA-deoxyinosine glycosylase [Bacilli bacterium]|nr:DNA-deoxyinosine glycosylase [Bacilli bacterium]